MHTPIRPYGVLRRHGLRLLARSAGVRQSLRRHRRRSIAILMYHGVTSEPLPAPNWCHITQYEFAEQMRFLANTYRILPLEEVVDRLARRLPLPDLTACITFDDAFEQLTRTAIPLLADLQAPSTVFVATGLAASGQMPWAEALFAAILGSQTTRVRVGNETLSIETAADKDTAYRKLMSKLITLSRQQRNEACADLLNQLGFADMPALKTMTWDDISRLAGTGLVSFGAHTHTHEILPQCPPDIARDEVECSRRLLLERLGSCNLFAYPNGDLSPDIERLVRDAGFGAAVTTVHALTPPSTRLNLFRLPRLGIGSGISLRVFEMKLLGL